MAAAFTGATVIPFRPRQTPALRADVPVFDPTNPTHIAAWEALFAYRSFLERQDGR